MSIWPCIPAPIRLGCSVSLEIFQSPIASAFAFTEVVISHVKISIPVYIYILLPTLSMTGRPRVDLSSDFPDGSSPAVLVPVKGMMGYIAPVSSQCVISTLHLLFYRVSDRDLFGLPRYSSSWLEI